ncbi:AbiJ-NTD4 domain-containing protein [Filifactor alocis]
MLYTQRHGLRKPVEKTYDINIEMYSLLFDCCNRYKKNLTHIFPLNCHHDFTNSDYLSFDEKGFANRIKIVIPTLYKNEYGVICSPDSLGYDQFALIDYIEFFAQNIEDISEEWNNLRYKNYQYIDCLGTRNIFEAFRKEINELFGLSGLLYELTNEAIVERIVVNSILTQDIQNIIAEVEEEGVRELLKDAIALYKTPNSAARQDSVEKIWDAFERLKTYYTSMDKKQSSEKIIKDMSMSDSNYQNLFNKEFVELTSIGNNFRIRHHETNKIDIPNDRYYDYLFNRCLSLIALAIQYLEK